MQIETKYNIGDKVWIIYEGTIYNPAILDDIFEDYCEEKKLKWEDEE